MAKLPEMTVNLQRPSAHEMRVLGIHESYYVLRAADPKYLGRIVALIHQDWIYDKQGNRFDGND